MIESSLLLSELINNYPELPVDQLSQAVLDLIGDEEFQIRLISTMDAPSKGELALKRKRVQRFSYNRKNKEVEKLEFLESLVRIKNSLENQEVPSIVWQKNLPAAGITEPYQMNKISSLLDGFTGFSFFNNVSNGGIGNPEVRNIKQKIDEKVLAIKQSAYNGIPLSIYEIKDITQARDFYSGDTFMMKELLDILKKDVKNRNRSKGSNVIKNEEELLAEIPMEINETNRQNTNSKFLTINKLIRGIILDELEVASRNLTEEFFQNRINFEIYIGKKTRLYDDASKIWQ